MDWATVLRGIEDALASDLGCAEKAVQIAELVRQAGSHRWVGLYAVTDQEITAIGWSGPGAPAHPHFPVTQGLSGAAVATGRAVVVNDVPADPRYLTAFASTLSEVIVPVVDPGTGTVVGTLDVETPSGMPSLTPTARRWLGAPPGSGFCLQQRGHRSPVGNVTVGGEGGHPSGTGSTLGGTRRWMIATMQARASQNATQARRRSMRRRSLPNLFNQACERSTTHRRASLDRGGTRAWRYGRPSRK